MAFRTGSTMFRASCFMLSAWFLISCFTSTVTAPHPKNPQDGPCYVHMFQVPERGQIAKRAPARRFFSSPCYEIDPEPSVLQFKTSLPRLHFRSELQAPHGLDLQQKSKECAGKAPTADSRVQSTSSGLGVASGERNSLQVRQCFGKQKRVVAATKSLIAICLVDDAYAFCHTFHVLLQGAM